MVLWVTIRKGDPDRLEFLRASEPILGAVDTSALSDFREAIKGPPQDVDLLGGALAVASIGRSKPDGMLVRKQLDRIASGVAALAEAKRDRDEIAQAVDQQLFAALGFQGSSDGLDDPENSFIDSVLERRRGIPISLALVYMEVASRAGLECRGVGFPGHFMVLVGDFDDGYFVDPFNQGQRIDRTELLARLAGADLSGAHPNSLLQPITHRQMLQRMLNNLRVAFRRAGRTAEWHQAVEFALAIEPWNSALVGERGMLSYRLGVLPAALEDLERYVGAQNTVSAGAQRLLAELRTRLKDEE